MFERDFSNILGLGKTNLRIAGSRVKRSLIATLRQKTITLTHATRKDSE
jgi:hypothetical protein